MLIGQGAANRGGAAALLPVLFLLMGSPAVAELVNTKLNGPIVVGGGVEDFKISPDGNWVVYRARRNSASGTDLYSVPIEGGTATRLNSPLSQGLLVEKYEITPDSRYVVLIAPLEFSFIHEIYRVPIEGPPQAWIKLNGLLPPGGNVQDFLISPNGSRVVYWADQHTDTVNELYSVPSDGPATAGARIAGPLVAGGEVHQFKISPDSARVVYRADRQIEDNVEIYSVPIAGPAGAWVKLNTPLAFQGAPIRPFEITADSGRVVYMATQLTFSPELFSVPIEGPASSGTQINGPLSTGGEVFRFQISPDGSRAVYLADQWMDDLLELYSGPVAGPGSAATRISHWLALGFDVVEFGISPGGGRVVYLVADLSQSNDVLAAYSVPINGPSVWSVRITKELDPGGYISRDFEISPNSAHVVSVAIQALPGDSEVFSVPIAGPVTEWKKLNRTTMIGSTETVFDQRVEISPDGSHVLYRVHHYKIASGENRVVLYRVPIEGPGSASVPFNGPMVDNGEVVTAQFAPDGEHVVYIADQETDELRELFVSYIPATQETQFTDPQRLQVAAGAAESWRYYTYNYTTGEITDDPSNSGSATVNVLLPYNQWIGAFVYSYTTAKWEEAIWYLKVDW